MGEANDHERKLEELRKRGALHPRPEQVRAELFSSSEFFDPHDSIQVKYEMLRRVLVDKQPVAHVARDHGYSRPTYYEVQSAFERDGLVGLLPRKRGPRRAHKLSSEVMEFINELRSEDPSRMATELAHHIHKRFKIRVHPRSIERALKREKKGLLSATSSSVPCDTSDKTQGYERLRTRLLDARHAPMAAASAVVLLRQGMSAWMQLDERQDLEPRASNQAARPHTFLPPSEHSELLVVLTSLVFSLCDQKESA